MILIEESKTGQLVTRKIGDEIAFMPLEIFLDNLGYVKENVVWWLFEMKDLVGDISGGTCIWIKDKYAEFTKRLSKPEVKRKVFLKLANVEEDEEEEDS